MNTATLHANAPAGGPASAPIATAGTGTPCLPCDIPAFCRNFNYRGKLLTEREFADEQRYFIDKMRLHALALHGWGVVCGLHVKPHPYCPDQRLIVDEGLAIDSCGREIRVLQEAWIELPPGPAAAQTAAASGAPAPTSAGSSSNAAAPPPAAGTTAAPPARDGNGEPTQALKTLYLCIAYTECETEFAPAPFDECGCNAGSSLKPNRVCEGFRLELYDSKPAFWDAAIGEECEAEDCRQYYREGAERCRAPGGACCVPLAVIMDVVPGEPVTERQIHMHGHRRQLASTETLDRVVRCILNKLPSGELTRIDDLNWEHGQRYLCREFLSEFVGSHEHPRGFRIAFTEKVHAGAINPRSFQALVVFRPEDPAQPRHMEIAPAEVHTEEGETRWCRLHIHPAYAHSRLDMRDFDLFITLKCDVITDLRGVAVDGNFIGRRLPTGDNIPGGTFESWIGVRPRNISA